MQQFTLERASHLLSGWIEKHPDEVRAKTEALERYGKYFAPDNLDNITQEGFKDFLLVENNRHWNRIYRHPEIYANMDRLRQCLKILLNEDEPIDTRLDTIIPKGGPAYIKGLNRAVLTAILMCAHPDKYAVYNKTSDKALALLDMNWAKAKDSFGKRYVAINKACHEIAENIHQPLHLVDTMFALMHPEVESTERKDKEDGAEIEVADDPFIFISESTLEDFIVANWDNTPFAKTLGLILHKDNPEDEDESAEQYHTDVGPIDILAHDKGENWVVIELKKGKGGQNAVGQTLKYMGWIKHRKATGSEDVRGLIITGSPDDKVTYALAMIQGISYYTYRVNFELTEQPILSRSISAAATSAP